MKKPYLIHSQTGSKFEVVKFDKVTNMVTLKGEYGEIVETFDKDNWLRLGYKLVVRETAEEVASET